MTKPQHCPSPRELDDLELLSNGALSPLVGFNAPGSPVTLELPPEVREAAGSAGGVELVDPEGLPLAEVSLPGWKVHARGGGAEHGAFRRLYLAPSTVRRRWADRTFVPVDDAPTVDQLAALAPRGDLVLLALVGTGTPRLPAVDLLRACLAAAHHLPGAVDVVAVPLAQHAEGQEALRTQVLSAYAGRARLVEPGAPTGELPADVATIVQRARPPRDRQGLVILFTGLSGSGKSTLAQALMDRVLEQGERTLTSLDGDVVRRNLSAGLTFSKEDRETNIRRIGWVAAEVSRHGGVAVCSPIAPFDETRQQVREMVEGAGGAFFLVHVATPLEECERRDRKGLYAKARRGEIPDFTGISSPYEEPTDADVRVDTTGRSITEALDDVLTGLRTAGYLDLPSETLRPLVEEARQRRLEIEAPETPTAGRGASEASLETSSLGRSSSDERQRGAGVETPDAPRPLVEEARQRRLETEAVEAPLRVLFVCTANICRSPFMELAARHLAAGDPTLEFASAGTRGFDAHEMDEVMAQTLAPRGIAGLETFRSRPFTRAELDWADVVLTAEAEHRTYILDDHPAAFRKVFTLGQFVEAAAAHDDLHGRELLVTVARTRGAASPELDVADPYRRGPEAAETAAVRIEQLVGAALSALSTKDVS